MRPFAAVLSIKRPKHPDPAQPSQDSSVQLFPTLTQQSSLKSRPTFLDKAPKTQVITTPPTRLRPSLNPGSSSSSSEGSTSLPTPEDDAMMVFPKPDGKKRWSNWIAWSRSAQPPPKETAQVHRDPPRKSSVPNLLQPPRLVREPLTDTSDEDEEDSDSSSSAVGNKASRHQPILTSTAAALAQSNLKALMRISLQSTLSPPPLVDLPSAHRFPRSSNKVQKLSFVHSMRSQMHVRSLVRRLERGNITRVEVASIAHFSARAKPSGPVRPVKKSEDDPLSFSSMRVGPLSRGLRHWSQRPCYEERVLVWTSDDMGNVSCTRVIGVGRGLAVAEIEFSERIEAISGMGMDDGEFEETLRQPVTKSQSSSAPAKLPLRSSLVVNKASSSLRYEAKVPSLPSSADLRKTRAGSLSRGVRFAEQPAESDDDDVPLGHAIQIKKDRERRELEERAEQRRKEEEERILLEERQREAALNREREERAKTKFAEEYAAARQRIETQRAGAENYTAYRDARARAREPSYSRPAYDSSRSHSPHTRKSGSEVDLSPDSWQSKNGSPSQSRPSSLYTPSVDSRRSSVMRGPNAHHASVEDLNSRRGRPKSSMYSNLGNGYPRSDASGSRVSIPRSNSTPVAAAMYPNFMYPGVPVPPLPQIPWNMPLLPPTPAFMLESYPRSHGSSPSRESSPSRSQIAGLPVVVAGNPFGGSQTANQPPSFKAGNEVQARRTSFRDVSDRNPRASRVLPASQSMREISTPQHPNQTVRNPIRRTTFA